MPLYEYRCTKCGLVFEEFAGFSANGHCKCPDCGSMAKRMISAPQVVFHGSGFYRTDSTHATSASTNGSSSSSSADTKTETKTAKPKASE